MAKTRKQKRRLTSATKKGGRKTRISEENTAIKNVNAVAPCPNNSSFECFNYPPEQHAYYHQAQFYPNVPGEDSKDCVLHTVNNLLGHSVYNKTTWARWISAIYSKLDLINNLVLVIEPLLSSLYYIKNEDDSEFRLLESNTHALSGWDRRFAAFKSGEKTTIFDFESTNMEVWEDNREYSYLMAWWLLSFRLIDGELMFFPMHLDMETLAHSVYSKETLAEYIEHRKPNPMKFCLGNSLRNHSYLVVEKDTNLIKINSMIWRKENNIANRQPKLSDSVATTRMTNFKILYQLKDTSTILDPGKASELLEEIIEEHKTESVRVYAEFARLKAEAEAEDANNLYYNTEENNASGGRRSKFRH
jgi:hypothetical protein